MHGKGHYVSTREYSCRYYLHGKGFIHRDLKPANLLVDHSYNVKVAASSHTTTQAHKQTNTQTHKARIQKRRQRGSKHTSPQARNQTNKQTGGEPTAHTSTRAHEHTTGAAQTNRTCQRTGDRRPQIERQTAGFGRAGACAGYKQRGLRICIYIYIARAIYSAGYIYYILYILYTNICSLGHIYSAPRGPWAIISIR